MTDFSAIILAAGKGTRMKSALPKPLHTLAHKPMLGYVVDACKAAGAKEIVLVIGPDDDKTAVLFPDCKVVIQAERKGTGHATLIGFEAITHKTDKVISIVGDQPFIKADTLRALANAPYDVTVLAAHFNPPPAYGRLVTNGNAVTKIVEHKDASDAERAITLCNIGLIALNGSTAKDILTSIKSNNAAGEFYMTDAVAIANESKQVCGYVEADPLEAQGANSRYDISVLERLMQDQLRRQHMDNGVTLIDPNTVYFAHDTVIGADTIIEPNVFFGPGVIVANNVHIKAFCHVEEAQIGAGCEIGPFARIRPQTVLAEKVKIGNFVEIKKSKIGAGSKVPHISYIGDAVVGTKTNIGGGSFTCNWDGYSKYQTTIGDNVLVGANTIMVAPVTLSDGVITAAGSVITETLDAGDLGIGRATQINKTGWADKFHARKKQEKEGK